MSSQPATKLRVALAQTCPVNAPEGPVNSPGNVFASLEVNLLDARTKVEEAKKEGADVVVFPEYCMQGLVNEGRQYLTYPSRHLLGYLSSLAEEHDISIVGTIVHALFAPEETLPAHSPFDHLPTSSSSSSTTPAPAALSPHLNEWTKFVEAHPGLNHEPALQNTAFFIEGGSGRVVDEYAKRNLWHPEREYLAPGKEEHQVFETKWGRCGFIICWDVSHPSSAQRLSDLGASIVFAPTYWLGGDSGPVMAKYTKDPSAYELELISNLSYSRAFETESAWIMVNAGGPAEEGFIGGSGVWMPLRGKVGGYDAVGGEVGVKVVDVDLEALKDAKELYKIREDYDARSGAQ